MNDIEAGKERDLKNIRQMGSPTEDDKIYIENAAYARVHEDDYAKRRAFIFMGHTECTQGKYATFVEAAIPVRDLEFEQNVPKWSTHAWSDVFREIKRSYENSIIVGWALDIKGFPPRLTPELSAVHREQFGGAHQVFLLMDSLEGEEYFYMNRGNQLQQKEGFYIYYAREIHKVRPAEVTFEGPRKESFQVLPPSGEASHGKYREKLREKGKKKGSSKATTYAMAAAVGLLVFIGAAGAAQGKINLSGFRQAVSTMGDQTGKAEQLAGSQWQEATQTTEKNTQTLTKPLDLIPIDKLPAGEIRKETEKTSQQETQKESQKDTQKEQAKDASTKQQNYYVVQEGDTLSTICKRRYGNIKKVEDVVKLNHMEDSDDIRAGQKLLLP